jgi:hypothetical protein
VLILFAMLESTLVVRWFDNGQEAAARKIDRGALVIATLGVVVTMVMVFR